MSALTDVPGLSTRSVRGAFEEILSSRALVFVSGKGGVGKSVVSALLALLAREMGKSPVLFECDAPRRPSPFPGGRAITDELREVVPGILAVNQDSEEAVRAYAHASLPSKALADLLFQNRVSRLFLRASPSVNEMALIGRVVQLAEERADKGPVIVDLHATGHALAMLRAPDGIMRVLRAGPVYERAKKVREFVNDKSRTAMVTVALPEELPVTELLEFLDQLNELGAPLGPVVANGVFVEPKPHLPDALLEDLTANPTLESFGHDLRFLRSWARRATREAQRLAEGAVERGAECVALPYISDLSPDETQAGRLAAELA